MATMTEVKDPQSTIEYRADDATGYAAIHQLNLMATQDVGDVAACCELLRGDARYPVESVYDLFLEAFTFYSMYADEKVREVAYSCIVHCLDEIKSMRLTTREDMLGEEPANFDMFLFELVYDATRRQQLHSRIVVLCGSMICDETLRQRAEEVLVSSN